MSYRLLDENLRIIIAKCKEITNEISFADRIVSFFSPKKSVNNYQHAEVMELNAPATMSQVMFVNHTSTIGMLDYHGNATMLNLNYNEGKSNDNDSDNNAIIIESTMVLSCLQIKKFNYPEFR